MTPDQLTNLRRLLANGDTLAGSHELAAAAVNALPELLDAAERETRVREQRNELSATVDKLMLQLGNSKEREQKLREAVEHLHSRVQRECAMTTRYANEAGALEGQVKELREALEANLWWYQDLPSDMSHAVYRARHEELGRLTRAALAQGGAK